MVVRTGLAGTGKQRLRAVALFRGLGARTWKSAELLLVSVHPAARRTAAVELERFGVGPGPSKQLAAPPYPTKSRICGPVGQVPLSGVKLETNATLPLVLLRSIVPMASAAGRGAPTPPPALPSATRRYCPIARVPVSGVTDHEPEPEAAYCTDQPVRSSGAPCRLKTSMKSVWNWAPALPPPP